MQFKKRYQEYLDLLKRKAILQQVREFIGEFISSDAREATKKIIFVEGDVTISVGPSSLEQYAEELDARLEEIADNLERMGNEGEEKES